MSFLTGDKGQKLWIRQFMISLYLCKFIYSGASRIKLWEKDFEWFRGISEVLKEFSGFEEILKEIAKHCEFRE